MIRMVQTAAVTGLEVRRVRAEVSITRGTPMIQIVGLAQSAVREGKERIRAAVGHVGLHVPGLRITVNLAPADIPKQGAGFDLPITIGILAAAGDVPVERLERALVVGELGLDGRVCATRGTLPVALHAADSGDIDTLIVPEDNAPEARAATGVDVIGVRTLGAVLDYLTTGNRPVETSVASSRRRPDPPDLTTVKGQAAAKRALEISAAGGHNVLLHGPPGAGKTSLARCLPGILPPLDRRESVEVTAIHSVAGTLGPRSGLIEARPFRSPHHSVSQAGLIGGGGIPRPGEASLAHRGVLFLDEFPEFGRAALESLRQPIEEGSVTIVRARAAARFPARFTLVAAMNPCPCGKLGDSDQVCTCTEARVYSYQQRVSGPLLDRIDMFVDVPAVSWSDLSTPVSETSVRVRERVTYARSRAARRGSAGSRASDPIADARLDRPSTALLQTATDRLSFSARAIHRTLRIARTIADLAGSGRVLEPHVAEAIRYRAIGLS